VSHSDARYQRSIRTYTRTVKKLKISIEEDVDAALAREAARTKTSKAALVRRFVTEGLALKDTRDYVAETAGAAAFDTGDIDEVVYE
jgi:hypothetical protein